MADGVEGVTGVVALWFTDVAPADQVFFAGDLVARVIEASELQRHALVLGALGLGGVFAVFVFFAKLCCRAFFCHALGLVGVLAVFVFFAGAQASGNTLLLPAGLVCFTVFVFAASAFVFFLAWWRLEALLEACITGVVAPTLFVLAALDIGTFSVFAALIVGTICVNFAGVGVVVVATVATASCVDTAQQRESQTSYK